jgi:hypothetical protein
LVSDPLRTGSLVGIDIDVIPPEHVHAIEQLAAEVLGHTLAERIGNKGAMLCYRNAKPIPKASIKGDDPALTRSKPLKRGVEILGAGQQFVAYGVHPDTGKAYHWPNAEQGGEPLQTPLAELPEVTPETLREFARRAAVLLAELGYANVSVSDPGDPAKRAAREAKRRSDRVPVPRGDLIDRLRYISPDCDRVQWIGFLGAIQATNLRGVPADRMDENLCEIACAWSRGDYGHGTPTSWQSDEDADLSYYTLDAEKLGGTTFGTIFRAARDNGCTKPPPGPTDVEKYGEAAVWKRPPRRTASRGARSSGQRNRLAAFSPRNGRARHQEAGIGSLPTPRTERGRAMVNCTVGKGGWRSWVRGQGRQGCFQEVRISAGLRQDRHHNIWRSW